MKEKLKVNPSKVSVSFFKQRNGAIGGTRYVTGDYLGQSTTRHCIVKTLLEYTNQSLLVRLSSRCVSVYVLSQWYYADFDLSRFPRKFLYQS